MTAMEGMTWHLCNSSDEDKTCCKDSCKTGARLAQGDHLIVQLVQHGPLKAHQPAQVSSRLSSTLQEVWRVNGGWLSAAGILLQ